MKILNYGSLNIDYVYNVPHIVTPGETLSSSALYTNAGGKGANQSVAIAKAGGDVWHAGKIGKDGTWLKNELAICGVHTDFITDSEGTSGHAVIQVNNDGENSIILYPGENHNIKDSEISSVLSHFTSGDYLVLQNEINNLARIINQAQSKGMKIIFNPAPFSNEVLSLPFEYIDTLVVNETEGAGIAETAQSIEAILEALSHRYPHINIILTAGPEGAYFIGHKDRFFIPAKKASSVDSTAAGDTFVGYYAVACIKGCDHKTAVQQAVKAAALTVSRKGAMQSIPHYSEIEF